MVGWSSTGDVTARGLFSALVHLDIKVVKDLNLFIREPARRGISRLVVNAATYKSAKAYLATIDRS